MKVSYEFQRINELGSRPFDYVLNRQTIVESDGSTAPMIGDHIHFYDEDSGEKGVFRVVNRLFSYLYRNNEWELNINIVVINDDEKIPELIKE